jgi:hypothetical protein
VITKPSYVEISLGNKQVSPQSLWIPNSASIVHINQGDGDFDVDIPKNIIQQKKLFPIISYTEWTIWMYLLDMYSTKFKF